MKLEITSYCPLEQELVTVFDPIQDIEFCNEKETINEVEINCNLDEPYFEEKDFNISVVFFEGHFFHLKKPLECQLEIIEDKIFIYNKLLDIRVWGNSKDDAIDALNFTFYSLYKNFAQEEDQNLTLEAKKVKEKLNNLVSFAL